VQTGGRKEPKKVKKKGQASFELTLKKVGRRGDTKQGRQPRNCLEFGSAQKSAAKKETSSNKKKVGRGMLRVATSIKTQPWGLEKKFVTIQKRGVYDGRERAFQDKAMEKGVLGGKGVRLSPTTHRTTLPLKIKKRRTPGIRLLLSQKSHGEPAKPESQIEQ